MLKLFTRDELISLFRTDEEFNEFLLKLPHDKEKLFLKFKFVICFYYFYIFKN